MGELLQIGYIHDIQVFSEIKNFRIQLLRQNNMKIVVCICSHTMTITVIRKLKISTFAALSGKVFSLHNKHKIK